MRRTMAIRRLASVVVAFGVTFLAPVIAGAAPSSVATVSRASGGVVAPVGQVQAALLIPGKAHKSSKAEPHPLRTMNPAALRKAKLEAAAASPASTAATPSTSTPAAASLFNGLNSPGLSAADEGNQPTPPDSTGAIGPTRYLEFVNQLVGVYDRSNLTLLSSTDLGTFTAVPSGLATSDPQIQWDPQGNRWFYGAVAFNSGFTNTYLLFGWSKTSDPSDLAGGWCRYASPTGSSIPDYPKLGHDANFRDLRRQRLRRQQAVASFRHGRHLGDWQTVREPIHLQRVCDGDTLRRRDPRLEELRRHACFHTDPGEHRRRRRE